MDKDLYVVCIGASSGGAQAIIELFEHLPDNTGAAFVIVRHLKRDVPSKFDEILQRKTTLKVEVASNEKPLEANHVYIMPETHKLRIKDKKFLLIDRPEKEIINYSIDEFLISLAEDVKDKAIAVILSGMLNDGVEGAKHLYKHGGLTIVQDPTTAKSANMPREVIKADHPYTILPPSKIPEKLISIIKGKEAEKRISS